MELDLVNRYLSTLPADDDHPYRTGAWTAQTGEWNGEWDRDDLDGDGEIPTDLDGVYVRNTENPMHAPIGFYHPFDGDGMIHVMAFQDGRASYRNRFVRTKGFEAEAQAGEALWAGLAEHPGRSKAAGMGRTREPEGLLVNRRRGPRRPDPLDLLPVRRGLSAGPADPGQSRNRKLGPRRTASQRTPRSTRRPVSCCSSTIRSRRPTCTMASSAPTTG